VGFRAPGCLPWTSGRQGRRPHWLEPDSFIPKRALNYEGMTPARDTAVDVLRTLRDAGFTAYFAGGCVRDELLGLHPKDYDIATNATPDDVRALFKRTNEVGASFGVMLVRQSRWQIEVTTFREEGQYSDRRRPDEVQYADAPSDAQRRDFTINALYLDPLETPGEAEQAFSARGRVIDFVGGLDDLRRRIIRAVGKPDDRLAEDHLRALRAVRIAARLGFAIEDHTADAIRRHAQRLEGVSRERIGDEMRLMLGVPTRAAATHLLEEFGLDSPALQEPSLGARHPNDPTVVARLRADASFETALAAWAIERTLRSGAEGAHDDELPARWRSALCLSNDERDALALTLRILNQLQTDWASLAISRQKRIAATHAFEGALQVLEGLDPQRAESIRQDYDRLASDGVGVSPEPLITGDDLIRAGVAPGPAMGAALRAIYDRQLEGAVRSCDEALKLAAEIIQNGSNTPRSEPKR